MSSPHLILTTGTNALPVLVAARHLLEAHPAANMTLLHSGKTEDQAKAVLALLSQQVPGSGVRTLKAIGNPRSAESVARAMEEVLANSADCEYFHLDYTGGTKLMGVEAFRALTHWKAAKPNRRFEDSYLSAESHAMSLVAETALLGGSEDERKRWSLTIDELAALHGFTREFSMIGHRGKIFTFSGANRQRTEFRIANDGAVDDAFASIGEDILGAIVSGTNIGVLQAGRWNLPWLQLPDTSNFGTYYWYKSGDPVWDGIPPRLNAYFGEECWVLSRGQRYKYEPAALSPGQIQKLHGLMRNGWLEIGCYEKLKKTLQECGFPFNLYHSLQLARTKPIDPNKKYSLSHKPFELDVIAVLGYQLVVISCTTNPEEVTKKSFEALHRAHQIGGFHARAVVVSTAHSTETARIQEIVQEETGISAAALEVWGAKDLVNLDDKFRKFLSTNVGWC